MFGIWQKPKYPMKLACRIRNEIERDLALIFGVLSMLVLYAVCAFYLGLVQGLFVMVVGIVALVLIVAICLIVGSIFGVGIIVAAKVTWDKACDIAKVDDFKKDTYEEKMSKASNWIGVILAVVYVVFIIAAAISVLGLLGFFALIALIVVAAVLLTILFLAVKTYGPGIYEWFWEKMGCPTPERRAELARQYRKMEAEGTLPKQ
jgi:uncharacterized membrane protein YkgB